MRDVFVIALFVFAVTGCEEDLASREHFELPFSLYGVLTPQLDTQSVRVYALEDFPTLGSPDPLDAAVTSTDLMTGEVVTWMQTMIQEPNGQYESIFKGGFRAEYGHRYRVEVRRSDGAMSFAEVRVPPEVRVTLQYPDSFRMRVRIEGEGIRALKPEVVYLINIAGDDEPRPISYWVEYWGEEQQVSGGWEVVVRLPRDRVKVQSWYNLETGAMTGSECFAMALRRLKFQLLVADSTWDPPGGVFDPNLLIHPGTMQNVQNGFGFIGGGYRIDIPLRPSRKAVEDACFVYDFVSRLP